MRLLVLLLLLLVLLLLLLPLLLITGWGCASAVVGAVDHVLPQVVRRLDNRVGRRGLGVDGRGFSDGGLCFSGSLAEAFEHREVSIGAFPNATADKRLG